MILRPAVIAWLALLSAGVPAAAVAQGGPPLVTDDPDTPGPGYWEINISRLLERHPLWRRVESPRLDVNLGIGRQFQFKVEAPWVSGLPGEPDSSGSGNMTIGLKWRFLGEEGRPLAWSVYPQIDFNTATTSVEKGLVDPGARVILPTEMTVEVAHVEINFEGGGVIAHLGPNEWLAGLSTEAELTKRLELVAEVHADGASGEPAGWIFNVGGRLKLTRQILLMLAAGRYTGGPAGEAPGALFYMGLQFSLPGRYSFQDTRPPRRR